MIEQMVAAIPDAEKGFTLVFFDTAFPGHQAAFEWRSEDYEGNWHYSRDLDMEGWLCPAVFKYFAAAPPWLYAPFKPESN